MSGEGNQRSQHEREREVFDSALGLAAGEERQAFLERVCAGDATFRLAVEALLRAHEDRGFMRAPAGGETRQPRESERGKEGLEGPGTRIGGYRLVRVVGQGGCGTVYEAEQEEPVRRRVALKILRPGMDTRTVIARFEAERQALALMDHPCIARVLDAGATSGGRPYFVMEFINGTRITEHVERESLGLRDRLQLFQQVCQAMQHAHQKGIVHRDLKPSNVLVGVVDGVAVPKVIDFGIAKALEPGGLEPEAETSSLAILGTPFSMSPEQVEWGGSKTDTRTDVYGLGVVLYAMLAGRPPFDPSRLAVAGLDGLRRILREEIPPPPSRAGTGREDLRGDLDWIVMKCLEKSPARRYETVNDLAMDVRRHLCSEPILARPPSLLYVARKFASRHRMGVMAAGLGLLVLFAGLGVSIVVGLEQRRLADAAEAARDESDRQRLLAAKAADSSRQQAYASDVILAGSAIRARDYGRARALLDAHRPKPGELDLRGWEWWHLAQECRNDAWYTVGRWPGGVSVLEPSADGEWLAVGGRDGGVSLWDMASRRELVHLDTGEGAPIIAASPEADLLGYVIHRRDGDAVRLWDVNKAQVFFEGSVPSPVRTLVFDTEGESFLAILGDGTWIRWGVPDGRDLERGSLPKVDESSTFSVRKDLRIVVVGGVDGRLRGFELRTGRELWARRVAREEAASTVISADGLLLAVERSSLGSGQIFEVETGRTVGFSMASGLRGNAARFSPDGAHLAKAGSDQVVRVTDLGLHPAIAQSRRGGAGVLGSQPTTNSPGSLRVEYRGHGREILALAWLANRRTLLSGDRDGVVLAWDTHQNPVDLAAPRLIADGARGWGFGPDGGPSVLTLDASGVVRRWRLAEEPIGERLFEIPTVEGPVLVSTGGERLAVGVANGEVEIWGVEERRRLNVLPSGGGFAEPLAFICGADRLVTRDRDGQFREWDLGAAAEIRRWRSPLPRIAKQPVAAVSADGNWWLEVDHEGNAAIHDAESGSERVWDLKRRGVHQLAWNGTATHWAGLTRSGDGFVWDRTTGRELASLQGFNSSPRALAFSSDGRRLAVAGERFEGVKLYETETFRELATIQHYPFVADSIAFSPDGLSLAIWGDSGRLACWRNADDGGRGRFPAPVGARGNP